MRIWKMAAGAVLVLLFIYLLYPRLADAVLRSRTAPVRVEAAVEASTARRDAFDQSHISETEWQEQRIVVVPNDYEE